jgi:hypothetical protein
VTPYLIIATAALVLALIGYRWYCRSVDRQLQQDGELDRRNTEEMS